MTQLNVLSGSKITPLEIRVNITPLKITPVLRKYSNPLYQAQMDTLTRYCKIQEVIDYTSSTQ